VARRPHPEGESLCGTGRARAGWFRILVLWQSTTPVPEVLSGTPREFTEPEPSRPMRQLHTAPLCSIDGRDSLGYRGDALVMAAAGARVSPGRGEVRPLDDIRLARSAGRRSSVPGTLVQRSWEMRRSGAKLRAAYRAWEMSGTASDRNATRPGVGRGGVWKGSNRRSRSRRYDAPGKA
jgi:hypothetical protein